MANVDAEFLAASKKVKGPRRGLKFFAATIKRLKADRTAKNKPAAKGPTAEQKGLKQVNPSSKATRSLKPSGAGMKTVKRRTRKQRAKGAGIQL